LFLWVLAITGFRDIGGMPFKRMENQDLVTEKLVIAERLETLNGGIFTGIRSAILERKIQIKKRCRVFYRDNGIGGMNGIQF